MPTLISPTITQVYDRTIPTKRRAAIMKQYMSTELQLQMLDGTGNPIDLTSQAIPGGSTTRLKLRVQEAIGLANSVVYAEQNGSVVTAATGTIKFPIGDDVSEVSGIYNLEVGVFGADNKLLLSNNLYLFVERGLFAPGTTTAASYTSGPPTLDEMRLTLRDNGPEDNRLIDDYVWDPAEICHALLRCVQYYNTSQPPIGVLYNSQTFPYRDLWMEGVCGQLFEIAANRYLQNDLQYTGGGLTIADQAKWQQYLTFGKKRWDEFTLRVRQKKVQLNCEAAMGSIGSSYGWFRGY